MQATGNMGGLADQTLMTAMDNITYLKAFEVLTSAGLVIGSSATTAVKIANTVTFKNFGRFLSKTTAEIAFTAGAASNIANGYEQCFLLQLDYAGNGLLIPGTPSLGAGTALFPERPTPSILTLVNAITATGAQTVVVSTVANLVNSSVINVDEGLNAEAVTLTAVTPISNSSSSPSIAGNFANLHPAGTIIKQGFSAIGAVRIYNNSGSVFTAGTTALTGVTGLTVTYYNGYPMPLFASAQ